MEVLPAEEKLYQIEIWILTKELRFPDVVNM
jgi:hypothetical protein